MNMNFVRQVKGRALDLVYPNFLNTMNYKEVVKFSTPTFGFLSEPFELGRFYTFETYPEIFIGVIDFQPKNGLPESFYMEPEKTILLQWFQGTGVQISKVVTSIGSKFGENEIVKINFQTLFADIETQYQKITKAKWGPTFSLNNISKFRGFVGFGIQKTLVGNLRCTISIDDQMLTFQLPYCRDIFKENPCLFIMFEPWSVKGIRIMDCCVPELKSKIAKIFAKGH